MKKISLLLCVIVSVCLVTGCEKQEVFVQDSITITTSGADKRGVVSISADWDSINAAVGEKALTKCFKKAKLDTDDLRIERLIRMERPEFTAMSNGDRLYIGFVINDGVDISIDDLLKISGIVDMPYTYTVDGLDETVEIDFFQYFEDVRYEESRFPGRYNVFLETSLAKDAVIYEDYLATAKCLNPQMIDFYIEGTRKFHVLIGLTQEDRDYGLWSYTDLLFENGEHILNNGDKIRLRLYIAEYLSDGVYGQNYPLKCAKGKEIFAKYGFRAKETERIITVSGLSE